MNIKEIPQKLQEQINWYQFLQNLNHPPQQHESLYQCNISQFGGEYRPPPKVSPLVKLIVRSQDFLHKLK